jgi:superfamily II DNA/RNA helicase
MSNSVLPTPPRFDSFGLAPRLLPLLEAMKIETPTPIQAEALPVAIEKRDLVGIAQTGSGKTLVYALSILTQLENSPEGRALVLTPSRETADQVHRVFLQLTKETPISVCLVTTGVPQKEQISQLKKNPRILIATPGRLNDFLQGNKLLLQGLQILVIDEADRMLDMGFEPQLTFMKSTLRGQRQTMLFAATFGPRAQALVKSFSTADVAMIRADRSEKPVSSLRQKVYFLTESQKENRLIDELRKIKGGVILFADSQESCVAVGRLLAHKEFSSEFVHGDMNPGHRNRVLREFREERFQILITTDLLARGLDVDHVQQVINYDLPYKADDFLHRIGRTARAGREGRALTFVTAKDGTAYRKIRRFLEGADEEVLATNFEFYEWKDADSTEVRMPTRPTVKKI